MTKSWKISFGTSLFFHALFLSVFLKIGLGNARSFHMPEPIEVELGNPVAGSPGSGSGRRAGPGPQTVRPVAKDSVIVPPAKRKADAGDRKQWAAVPQATSEAPLVNAEMKNAEVLPAPTSNGNGAVSGNGTSNGRNGGVSMIATGGSNSGNGGVSGAGNGGAPDTLPYVIRGPAPSYPSDARSRGITGKVRVKVLISEQGSVRNAFVAASSGHAALDDAALNGLRRWLFSPAHRDGRAVAAWVVVPVLFRLD